MFPIPPDIRVSGRNTMVAGRLKKLPRFAMTLVQKDACKSRSIHKAFTKLPRCLICAKGGPAVDCRFAGSSLNNQTYWEVYTDASMLIGFRALSADGKESFVSSPTNEEPRFTWVYNRKLTIEAAQTTKVRVLSVHH